ncbi:MAG: restriction endonuclease subunit [Ferruginibacter sp.]|nr:restriction endonuclease subunit [Ferruginibacter sp.]
MIKIEYPQKKPVIRRTDEKDQIFCLARKRWVILTPEEWVRQNFLLFLFEVMKYPASLIAVEKQLMLGELKKRFDIVVFKNDQPFMVIECKEMNVSLSQKTLEQAMRYNINLSAAYLVITNGTGCFVFQKEGSGFSMPDEFPAW